MLKLLSVVTVILMFNVVPAFAHLNPGEHGSFLAGLSHPFFGLDHILAMVAVGLWAALLGGSAKWLVPSAFVATMIVGFVVSLLGVGLPFEEAVVTVSVVILGLLGFVALQAPTSVGMLLVSFFAFFHGYAHGGELGEAGVFPFLIGFVIATALLHAVGLRIGVGLSRPAIDGTQRRIAQMAGGLTALAGFWMIAGG
ncbi:HupE/UreJ family protein [Mesorhizobium sp. CO1-1-8]|uniref:HupE/UreJ family protein n=1 Tax=Mesorhizobium sp. CO1-1-8 TaxID=2876631 RepID=UPI001CD04AE4|nr:HupE/UreJ family protein [Mesorhizobium sp. CO1-1-8]MBZ9774041.1 HupE/UreJ family protein [Mesorhizobium sp. CO1-1-8]